MAELNVAYEEATAGADKWRQDRMTTEAEREWRERVETLRNDARLRQQQQGTTFSQFAQAEAEEVRGRFSGHERATVVGASPIPEYPAAFHQRDPVPDEPALALT